MKTKFAFSAALIVMMMSGTIVWAQGRSDHRGNRGNGTSRSNDHQQQQRDQHHDRDRNDHNRNDHNKYQPQYSYDQHHNNHDHNYHHPDHQRVVYVHHNRPAERVVVHHYYNYDRPRYVYYRDYDVYYDYHRNVYISFSGRNWIISTAVPVKMYYADRSRITYSNVGYYDDNFEGYLDSRRPGGRHCDEW